MNRSYRAPGKLLLLILMISLLVTGCSSLPTTVADAVRDTMAGTGDTITISKEQYERMMRYAELDELLQIVETYYFREPDVAAMIENAERGLLYGLEDPYTYFYNAQEYSSLWEDDKGEYAGIGIQLMASYETYLCTITRVFTDTPAYEQGMRKGDILVKVDELEVNAYTMQEAVDIMRGEVGETVAIQVERDGQLLDFVVPRAMVHINWVSSRMLDDQIGYIVLYEFSGDCSEKFQQHLDDLLAQGMKGLVVDLRDNPGGWVDDAIRMADIFLPENTITYLEKRDGSREYYTATAGEVFLPMAVLINENSASASEILSGALQDYDKATIVGTTSFGKGVVQYVLPVGSEGAGMQITAAQYFTPNGNAVHEVGITPDVEVSMPEGDDTLYELGDLADNQLNKAYEVVQQLMEEAAP